MSRGRVYTYRACGERAREREPSISALCALSRARRSALRSGARRRYYIVHCTYSYIETSLGERGETLSELSLSFNSLSKVNERGQPVRAQARNKGGREGGIIVLLNYYRDQSTSLHSHMSASSVSFSLLLVPLRLMEIGRAPLARGGGCGTLVVGWAVSSAASAWPSAASSW